MADELLPRDELNQLLIENGQREEEVHRVGACSDAVLGQLRVQAFIDTLVEHFGIGLEFALQVERQKAQAQEAILAQAKRMKLAVPGGGSIHG